jgi:hypothetical protein
MNLNSFFDKEVVCGAHRWLFGGGHFILDVRNPENPKARFRTSDWRTWREAGGRFFLERHELNKETGNREDAWISIDPGTGKVEEKVEVSKPLTLADKIETVTKAGFKRVELRTMEAKVFAGGEEPYWLWLVAEK